MVMKINVGSPSTIGNLRGQRGWRNVDFNDVPMQYKSVEETKKYTLFKEIWEKVNQHSSLDTNSVVIGFRNRTLVKSTQRKQRKFRWTSGMYYSLKDGKAFNFFFSCDEGILGILQIWQQTTFGKKYAQ